MIGLFSKDALVRISTKCVEKHMFVKREEKIVTDEHTTLGPIPKALVAI